MSGYRAFSKRFVKNYPILVGGFEIETDMTLLSIVGIIDPPREEAGVAIAEAHRAGIRVIMITGDHPLTASTIARELGKHLTRA